MDITVEHAGLTLRGVLEGTDTLENDTIAILMHGFMGNRGYAKGELLYDLSHALNDSGIPTVRFDFSGCGQSDGDVNEMTVPDQLTQGMEIVDFVRAKLKAKKIYLIGHSQGGVDASMIAGAYDDVLEKLVLLAPAATLKSDALAGVCQGLTYDPKKIPLYVTVHDQKITGRYFRTAQLLPIYETAKHFIKPTLIMHGLADQVVSPKASEKYHEVLSDNKLYLLPDDSHQLAVHRATVLQKVTEFLTK